MFERFTEEARRSLLFARCKTTERHGDLITDEDLLNGISLGGPDAIKLLGEMAADALRSAESGDQVLAQIDREAWTVPGRFSASASAALQFATTEAESLRHNDIGPEHLLLGLLRDEGTEAWRRLHKAGVRLTDLRSRVGSWGCRRAHPAIPARFDRQ